jgi:hypothetical protein
VSRPREHGSIHPLPHTSSWRSALLSSGIALHFVYVTKFIVCFCIYCIYWLRILWGTSLDNTPPHSVITDTLLPSQSVMKTKLKTKLHGLCPRANYRRRFTIFLMRPVQIPTETSKILTDSCRYSTLNWVTTASFYIPSTSLFVTMSLYGVCSVLLRASLNKSETRYTLRGLHLTLPL